MNRLILLVVMAAVALSLSTVPALQLAAHAEGGTSSDTKAAAKGTAKSVEGSASDTKDATTKSVEGAISDTKETPQGTGKSLMDKAGKVKTDAGKTKDSATSLDVIGTTQGASDTKQSAEDLKEGASEVMKNPFGK